MRAQLDGLRSLLYTTLAQFSGAYMLPAQAAAVNQPVWYIRQSTGNDANDGKTYDTAIQSWGEFHRRTGLTWQPEVSVDIYVYEDPPGINDRVNGVDEKFHLRPMDWRIFTPQAGNTTSPNGFRYVRIHTAPTTVYGGTLTASAAFNPATNTPATITDTSQAWNNPIPTPPGAASPTRTKDCQLVRIVGGPRDGATSWTAPGNNAIVGGQIRHRGFLKCSPFFTQTNFPFPTIVTPQVGDQYVVQQLTKIFIDNAALFGNGDIYGSGVQIDSAEICPSWGYADTALNSPMVRVRGGCITLTNCLFDASSMFSVDQGAFVLLQNCAGVDAVQFNGGGGGGADGEIYVWGGLYHLGITAQNGAIVSLDYDACAGPNASINAVDGGRIDLYSAQVIADSIPHGVDGLFQALEQSSIFYGGQGGGPSFSGHLRMWGAITDNTKTGLHMHSDALFVYPPGNTAGITATGGLGDVSFIAGSNPTATTARTWDENAGGFTTARTLTWANIFTNSISAGGFSGSVRDPNSGAKIYPYINT
jgi:hypothetical protein